MATLGPNQWVRIETEPPGATVTVLPEGQQGVTPVDFNLKRKSVHTVEARLEGYAMTRGYLDRKNSGVVVGNLLVAPFWIFGSFVGTKADYETGSAFSLTPDPLVIELKPITATP